MKNNFPKIKFFLSAIFFALSCFTLFFFYREINNKKRESQLKEIEWQNEAQRRDEINALDHSVKIIEEEKKELETHFAQSSDVVPFLNTIEGLASKVNTKAEIISVNISDDHASLLVGMKASGSFENLYKLLTLLENSPYALEFVSMNMSRETEANMEGKSAKVSRWNAVFKIKLLSFIN